MQPVARRLPFRHLAGNHHGIGDHGENRGGDAAARQSPRHRKWRRISNSEPPSDAGKARPDLHIDIAKQDAEKDAASGDVLAEERVRQPKSPEAAATAAPKIKQRYRVVEKAFAPSTP